MLKEKIQSTAKCQEEKKKTQKSLPAELSRLTYLFVCLFVCF